MLDAHFATSLGFGLLLGGRHALDADHLVAISTLLSREPDLRRSGVIGLSWGIGHSLTLLLVAALVLLLHVSIPPSIAAALEFGVGGLLVWLGVSLAATLVRERWHLHPHEHDGTAHLHLHSHSIRPDHVHPHTGLSWRSMLVGMAHGLAGSAALMLVVLSTVSSIGQGLLYVVAFGVGSIIGMVGVGLLISVPLVYSAARSDNVSLALQGIASASSVVLGCAMMLGFRLA